MKASSRLTRLGAGLWVGGFILFFVAQIVVGAAWHNPTYSWSNDNVSDLGNVYCQPWVENGRPPHEVCSPLHGLMNTAFIIEGLCVIVGVLLTSSLWRRRTWPAWCARAFLAFAGLGVAVAGLAPADVNENAHVTLGALPIALFGNLGLLLAGWGVNASVGKLRWLAPILGLIGLIAAPLFLAHIDFGLGSGGMERLWGYNFLVWAAIIGCALLYIGIGRNTKKVSAA